MKQFLYVLVLCGCIGTLCACGNSSQKASEADKAENSKLSIGFSFDSLVIERWQRDRDVFVMEAKKGGATVNIQNAHGSIQEQIEQLQYLIDKNVDVIVVIPTDSESLKDVLTEAKLKGINIIAYDRYIKGVNLDLYLSFDNKQVGELMAKYMVSKVKKGGKLLSVMGPTTDNNVSLVESGIRSVVSGSGISIKQTYYTENWKSEKAFDYVSKYLTEDTDVDGIFCGNDDLANQVIRALSEKGLAGKVVVTGQDGDLIACQHIVEGMQGMTVYKDVNRLATAAALAALTMARNNEYETNARYTADGENTPYVCFNPYGVTSSNMKKIIIDSGFHLKDEVYLNLE